MQTRVNPQDAGGTQLMAVRARIQCIRLINERVHGVELRQAATHPLNRVGQTVHEVAGINEQSHHRDREQRGMIRHHINQHKLHRTGKNQERQQGSHPERQTVTVHQHAQTNADKEQTQHNHAGNAHRLREAALARLLRVLRIGGGGGLHHGNHAGQRKGRGNNLLNLLLARLMKLGLRRNGGGRSRILRDAHRDP